MVSDLKTFSHKGCEIGAAKKVVFLCFLLLYLFTLFKRLLPPLPKVQCPNFLDVRNPWGKVMEKSVSDLKTFAHKGCIRVIGIRHLGLIFSSSLVFEHQITF